MATRGLLRPDHPMRQDSTVVSTPLHRARQRLQRVLTPTAMAASKPLVAAATAPLIELDEDTGPRGVLRELADVVGLLKEHALVTLIGGEATGKSTLAGHLARAQRGDNYPGGVFVCDLAEVSTHRELLEAVAVAIGLGPLPAATHEAISSVETALACRERTLLVVDGFDHLSLLAGDTLERWCAGAPTLRVLVTAREPLGVEHEATYAVARTRAARSAAVVGRA